MNTNEALHGAAPQPRATPAWSLLPLLILLACGAEVRSTVPVNGGTRDAGHRRNGATRDAALAPDDDASLRACRVHDDCALLPKTCCGDCSRATPTDSTSVRWDRVGDYRASVCEAPGCPACAREDNPNLTALCRAGRCEVVDVRNEDFSACTVDADCWLRLGTRCCLPCFGTPAAVTALARGREADAVRCSPPERVCPECVAVMPEGVRAACNPTTKHCEVVVER